MVATFNMLVAAIVAASITSDVFENSFKPRYILLGFTRLTISALMTATIFLIRYQPLICFCLIVLLLFRGVVLNMLLLKTIRHLEHINNLFLKPHEQDEFNQEIMVIRLEELNQVYLEFKKIPVINHHRLASLQQASCILLIVAIIVAIAH